MSASCSMAPDSRRSASRSSPTCASRAPSSRTPTWSCSSTKTPATRPPRASSSSRSRSTATAPPAWCAWASCATTPSSARSARPRISSTTGSSGRRAAAAASMSPHLTAFPAPSLDPVALLRRLGLEGHSPVVLLDSAGGSPQLARRHYLAWDPVFRLRVRGGTVSVTTEAGADWDAAARDLAQRAGALEDLEPFEALRAATRLATLHGVLQPAGRADIGPAHLSRAQSAHARDIAAGFPEAEALFGLLAYDAVRYLERLPDTTRDDLGLPGRKTSMSGRPRSSRVVSGRLLRYDIATGEALLLDRLSRDEARAAAVGARVGAALASARHGAPAALHGNDLSLFRSNFTRPEYEAVVARTREYVYAGDIFQANLSQRLDGIYALPSLHLYQTVRSVW